MSTETARVILGTILKDAGQVAGDLESILAETLRTQECPHATVKVSLQPVTNVEKKENEKETEHVRGKKTTDQVPLEFKEGDTYKITIKNNQATPQYPVIYFPAVAINTVVEPLLNTWFTSSSPVADGLSTTIYWAEIYSVTLSAVIVKEGETINETIAQRASLGQQVNFTLKGGIPSYDSTTSIPDKSLIQVYLEPGPGFNYENWAVGFGIADPKDNDTPVKLVQADANILYKFTPYIKNRYYTLALAPTSQPNMLLKESDVTDFTAIQFMDEKEVTAIHNVDGTWTVQYPSLGTASSN